MTMLRLTLLALATTVYGQMFELSQPIDESGRAFKSSKKIQSKVKLLAGVKISEPN
jgi:hypothetical protein